MAGRPKTGGRQAQITLEDIEAHLLSFAQQLRSFTLDHPGLASYMQSLFPRGASGVRLQREAIAALGRRGYSPAGAVVMSARSPRSRSNLTAAEERHRPYHEGQHTRELEKVYALLATDEVLAAAHAELPQINSAYFRMVMTGCIRGLTSAAPPGRPVADVLQDLGLE
ncbi:hypothetical protein ACGFIF_16270 [Kribbella sp. NPDC049174]|uniref:hypothetical protein n=1 Tax=Kribbella sp. NPDC049174 TaxID=3364112 RepID=UPI0037230944